MTDKMDASLRISGRVDQSESSAVNESVCRD